MFKKPGIMDKPIEILRIQDIALHFIQSIKITSVSIYTNTESEKIIVPLKGAVKFNELMALEKDMIYIPMGISRLDLSLQEGSIVYVLEAMSNTKYKPYLKRFGDAMFFDIGDERSRRRRYLLIGEEDASSRFLAGYTHCCPGCWGSFPPHRHDDKYELFVYYDVEPGLGVQLIINDDHEEAYIVRDYDAVLVTRGYHPNVSTPVKGLKYLWVMIAMEGKRDFKMQLHPVYIDVVKQGS
ncbi:MAG: 5-deoxy-glucuronate isomerase [Desulfurococcaceae archaeon]